MWTLKYRPKGYKPTFSKCGDRKNSRPRALEADVSFMCGRNREVVCGVGA